VSLVVVVVDVIFVDHTVLAADWRRRHFVDGVYAAWLFGSR